jgi:protease-4
MSTVPASPPPQIVIQQQPPSAFGRYGRFLVAALAIAIITIIGQAASYRRYFSPAGAPQEKYHSLSEDADQKIAIIKVEGTIWDAEGFVKKQIDRVRQDDDVVAVVLRVDSPGGTVTASDYLYHQLRDLVRERKLPMVVSMGGICASGGYYLAMAAGDKPDVIFAENTTWCGSIGVMIPHYDLSGLLGSWNVKDDTVASSKYKLMGSFTRALTPEEKAEERKLLQELVDRSFERFKEVVRNGRPKLKADAAALAKAANGQIFTADQALELGLVDKLGFIDAAIARAAELAGREPEGLRCVKYEQPSTPLQSIMGASTQGSPANAELELAKLIDLAAPRAYFLCSWLPAWLSNAK